MGWRKSGIQTWIDEWIYKQMYYKDGWMLNNPPSYHKYKKLPKGFSKKSQIIKKVTKSEKG
jgi:hypothetical protein